MSIHHTAPWLRDNRYGGKRKLVMLAIADVVNAEGVGFISQRQAMAWAGASEDYVRLSIKQFIDDGVLEIVEKGRGPGRATVYRLNPPSTQPPLSEGELEEPPFSDGQPPVSDGEPPVSAWEPPSFTSVLTPPEEQGLAADANEPPEPTPGQIANQITQGFYDQHNGAVNFNAVRTVVTKLVKAGYAADRIAEALTVTEDRGAPLTVDVLRQQLEGRRQGRQGKFEQAVDAVQQGRQMREQGVRFF